MARIPDNPSGSEPGLAPELAAALRETHAPAIAVARRRDDEVLADAARTLGRRRFFARPGVRTALAVAAMLLIACSVQLAILRRAVFVPRGASQVAADIDADGRVDIVDAMVLAGQVRGAGLRGRDINGDGVIDQRDVDAVAQVAVRLDRGGA